jgi:hypothetical protein
MFTRKLTTTLAILVATAGVSVFAASANAVVVDNEFLVLDSEEDDLSDGNLDDRVHPRVTVADSTPMASDGRRTRGGRRRFYARDAASTSRGCGCATSLSGR